MKTITTPHAPKPAGHYSQAVIHDNIVYVSGQLPIVPEPVHCADLRTKYDRPGFNNMLKRVAVKVEELINKKL